MKNRMTAVSVASILASLAALIVLLPTAVVGFCPTSFSSKRTTFIQSTSSKDSVKTSTEDDMFPDATILEFTLEEHKPLGCTVEESLAHTKEKHVFVTKLVDDGFAKAAGLQVGDVLLAVPGIFGDLTNVTGLGIEQVKSLVSGLQQDEPLQLRIARGTNVMEQHEEALVELCMTPGANDKEVEDCVTTIMAGAYADDEPSPSKESDMECNGEDECLLDDMMAMWAEDMPGVPKPQETDEDLQQEDEPAIAPWSSRSSPSGTYQRDPATGEMKRIS